MDKVQIHELGPESEQQFGLEIESLKELMRQLVRSGGGMVASKWIWGMDLTKDDLYGLLLGANHQGQTCHTEYDSSLPPGKLQSESSTSLDLDDPQTMHFLFDS